MVNKLLPPIAIAVVLGVVAALAVWAQQPWFVPSLGSAVFVQTLTPEEAGARPWNTGIGQLLGVAGGFVGVFLAGAVSTPAFMGDHALVLARVLAAVIAVALTAALQTAAKATSPAGGAAALVVAIGAETANWAGAGRLVVGILLVTALGEAARQLVLRTC